MMKNKFSLLSCILSAALMTVVSCSRIEELSQVSPFTVKAVKPVFEGTKTTLDNNSVEWVKGEDALNVFDAEGHSIGKFVADESGAVVSFTCAVPNPGTGEPEYAVYPYCEDAECSAEGVISSVLPSLQNGDISSAMYAARNEGGLFAFAHLCSVAKLTVPIDTGIDYFDISSESAGLSGDVEISFSGNTPSIQSATADYVRTNVDYEDGEAICYVSLNPTVGKAFSFSFHRVDDAVATKTVTLTNAFSCGVIKDLGTARNLEFIPGVLPDIHVDVMISGPYKAGLPINIAGTGFVQGDEILFGSFDGTSVTYYDAKSVTITAEGVSFGAHVYDQVVGKTVKVYVRRDGQCRIVSNDITIIEPEVGDGYIPDQTFCNELCLKNSAINSLVLPLGLFDVAQCAALTSCDGSNGGITIDWSNSTDWTGLELFPNIGNTPEYRQTDENNGLLIKAWYSQELVNADFSNWEAPCQLRLNNSAKLETLVAGPNMLGMELNESKSLKTVDLHKNRYAKKVELAGCSNVSTLDIRRDQSDDNYLPLSSVDFRNLTGIAANATILIDSYAFNHQNNSECAYWSQIEQLWREKGATIKVYDALNIDHLLGTVPHYLENPSALSNKVLIGSDSGEETQMTGYNSSSAINVQTPSVSVSPAGGLFGMGVEMDPFFHTYSFYPLGRDAGISLSDWDNVYVPRIRDMQIQRFRVMVQPHWYEPSEGNYTFDSKEMNGLYKVLDVAQETGADVTLVLWGCPISATLLNNDYTAGSAFRHYLADDGSNWVTATGNPQKFAVSIANLLKHLIDVKGYTCVREFTPYNEPDGNVVIKTDAGVPIDFDSDYPGYRNTVNALKARFDDYGLSSKVGLNLSDNTDDSTRGNKFLNYCATDFGGSNGIAKMFNTHCYIMGYETPNSAIKTWEESNVSRSNGKPHFIGEVGSNQVVGASRQRDINEYRRGVHLARVVANLLNGGAAGASYWILFDERYTATDQFNQYQRLGLWTYIDSDAFYGQYTSGGQTYDDRTGKPSGNFACRPQFYAFSLMTRFIRKGSYVYPLDLQDDFIAGTAILGPDGKWTYLFANYSGTDKSYNLSNGNSGGMNNCEIFKYNQGHPGNGQQIQAEAVLKADGNALKVFVPSNSVLVLHQN